MNLIDVLYRASALMVLFLLIDIAMDGKIDLPVFIVNIDFEKAWQRLKKVLKK